MLRSCEVSDLQYISWHLCYYIFLFMLFCCLNARRYYITVRSTSWLLAPRTEWTIWARSHNLNIYPRVRVTWDRCRQPSDIAPTNLNPGHRVWAILVLVQHIILLPAKSKFYQPSQWYSTIHHLPRCWRLSSPAVVSSSRQFPDVLCLPMNSIFK